MPFSRLEGKKTIVFIFAFAPCAETEPARFPVEAQAKVSKSNSSALAVATETTRSLKEKVGLTLSFFIYNWFNPSSLPRLLAFVNGVMPVSIPTSNS